MCEYVFFLVDIVGLTRVLVKSRNDGPKQHMRFFIVLYLFTCLGSHAWAEPQSAPSILDSAKQIQSSLERLRGQTMSTKLKMALVSKAQVLTFLKHLGVQKLSKRNLVESHLLPVLITHPQVCSLLSAHFTKPAQCIGDRPPSGLISPCWAG